MLQPAAYAYKNLETLIIHIRRVADDNEEGKQSVMFTERCTAHEHNYEENYVVICKVVRRKYKTTHRENKR